MWNDILRVSVHRITAVLAAFLLLATLTVATAPSAASAPGDRCYVFSDGDDRLYRWDADTSTQTLIGPASRANIEAIAYDPVTGNLYAADTGQIGILDQTSGAFTAIGPDFGLDLDGMAVHPFTGELFVSIRNGGAGATDELAVIDLTTLVMTRIGPITGTLDDIDDLGFDPTTGRLYAGTSGNGAPTLVRLDESYGYVDQFIGAFGVQDVEGLDWDMLGNVWATTGADGSGDSNKLFSVDPATGAATFIADLTPGSDFEAVACSNTSTTAANTITGAVFFDGDTNGSFGGADQGTPGHRVRLYRDLDGNGVLDAADDVNGDGSLTIADARAETLSANDGSYRFDIAATGAAIVVLDTATLPAGSTLTTPGSRTADFGTGFGLTDAGNDLGYIAPGDLDVTKTSDATGMVNPGDTLTYRISIENTGSVRRSGITVTDALPTGTSWISTTVEAPAPAGAPTIISDDFSSRGYGGGVGWLGPWTEGDDDGSSSRGLLRIANDSGNRALRVGGNTNPPTPNNITRAFDVAGAQSVTLDFTKRDNSLETGENVTVEIFDGSSWSTLVVYPGSDPNDGSPVPQSFDITPYASTNTQLRFRPPSDTNQGNDYMVFDNFVITAQSRSITTNPGGAPPTLVTSADGYDLFPGEAMTVTTVVQVNDPIAYGITSIDNTVVVTNLDQLGSNTDSVSDPVNLGSIGDTVFIDADGSGAADPGEGIGNVAVTLTGTDAAGNPVTLSTSTDGAGVYSFGDLPRGDYTVAVDEADPDFPTDMLQTIGTNPHTVTLATGDDRTDVDFGYRDLGSIGDAVFIDIDADGALDAGEGIPGITVTLTGTDELGNPVSLSTVTDTGGLYTFAALLAGSYTVVADESDPDFPGDLVQIIGANPQSFALASGEDRTDVDFGYDSVPASLAGAVYHDLDNDGVRDAGEPGIAAAQVTVAGTDRFGAAVNVSTTTDGTGTWRFATIRPSDAAGYAVTEAQPAGYLDGTDAAGSLGGAAGNDVISGIVIAAADAGTGYVFGEVLAASLTGSVFLDADNDGVPDTGETGLGGVEITLTGIDDLGDPVSLTTTTAADGSWAFNGLRPGSYHITETHPAGWLDGTDTAGSLGGTAGNDSITGIDVGSGDAGTGYTFAELEATSLSGVVFDDLDNDGLIDGGEAGISGVTIILAGTDDLGAPVSRVATTAADGTWTFPDLRPGTYEITETQPAGWLDGLDTAGSLGGTVGNDTVTTLTLAPGQAGTGYSFGELQPAAVTGTVYEDNDGSGTFTPGDLGIQGVTVTLSGTDDLGATVIASTTTDLAGTYTFVNLRPGTYTVTESQPAAYLDGPDAAGSLGGVLGNDAVSTIPVAPGDAGSGYDFGEVRPASVSGSVFADTDNDGVQGAGETGILGVTITLTGTNDVGDAVRVSTATDANGDWWFTGLRPGVYDVAETQPAGYLDGIDTAGTAGGAVGNDAVTSIVLSSGQTAGGYTFGELVGSSVAGSVYLDAGNDGVRDLLESGIFGVTVTLTGTDDLGDSVSQTTTTDGNGAWGFTDLRPGDYTIAEIQPAGLFDGIDTVGSQGGAVMADDEITISLPAATTGTGNDFGELAPAAIGDFVWLDVNDDGVQDPTQGLGGIVIELYAGDGATLLATTTTADDGSYSFADIAPYQDYVVAVAAPAGAAFTALPGTDETDDSDVAADGRVTVTPVFGDNFDLADAGVAPAAMSGRVWFDVSGDGVLDATELGLGGVTVQLSDALGTVVDATSTAPDGTYSFAGLPPGGYAVVVAYSGAAYATLGADSDVDPATGIASVTLSSGMLSDGGDAGVQPARLGDLVWLDLDADGIQGPGEPGIAGVPVTLLDGSGTVMATTATDPSGTYLFTVLPGGYQVVVSPIAGAAVTTPGIGAEATDSDIDASGATGLLTATSGNHTDLADAGIVPAIVTGTVWLDLDGDGFNDDTTPVEGVTIELRDDVGSVLATTSSAADGSYSFTGLAPGAYTVVVVPPDGAPFTIPGGDSDVEPATGSAVVVAALSATVDAGILPGFLGGTVWLDLDGDGAQTGESGAGGVAVSLLDAAGTIIATTTTDGSGGYSFGPLTAGGYTIVVDPTGLPSGTAQTFDADGTPDDTTSATLPLGANLGGLDFGYQPPATITGIVFADTDGDGTHDAGEDGLGVGVEITDASGTTVVVATAADGSYAAAVTPGAVTIDVVESTLPSGAVLTTGNEPQAISAPSAEATAAEEIGYQVTAHVSGRVWRDADRSGTQDAGEGGLAGIPVRLIAADGTVRAATVTAADGTYGFTGIAGGHYTVAVDESALPAAADNPTADPDGVIDGTTAIRVAPGADVAGLDFGYGPHAPVVTPSTEPAGLNGTVWVDTDGDGVVDATEGGQGGITIIVTWLGTDGGPGGGDDEASQTVTAADGTYFVTDLPPGRYEVVVDGATIPPSLMLTTCPGACDGSLVELVAGETMNDLDFGLSPVVDLTATVKGDGTAPLTGATAIFTVTVGNAGPGNEPGPVRVTLVPGEGLELLSAGGNGWTAEVLGDGTVLVTLDEGLAAGAGVTFPVVATIVDEAADLTVYAAVTGAGIDIDPANNADVAGLGLLPFTGIALFTLLRIAVMILGCGLFLLLLVSTRRRDSHRTTFLQRSVGPLQSAVGRRPERKESGRPPRNVHPAPQRARWQSGTPPNGEP